MNFSTVPPYRPTTVRHSSKYAGQQLTDLLGVAGLGQGGEPDQVTEEDRGEPSLGHGERGFRSVVGGLDRGAALRAKLAALGGRPAGWALP